MDAIKADIGYFIDGFIFFKIIIIIIIILRIPGRSGTSSHLGHRIQTTKIFNCLSPRPNQPLSPFSPSPSHRLSSSKKLERGAAYGHTRIKFSTQSNHLLSRHL